MKRIMRNKFILSALLIIVLLVASLPLTLNARAAEESAPAFQQADIIPGELIIGMAPGDAFSALSLPEKAHRSIKKRTGLDKLNAGVVTVPKGEEGKYIAQLKKEKGVLFVEPNYRVNAFIIPNDSLWVNQYGPALIQAPAAWNITTGSSGVILAVIDSGIDASHPEFSGRIVPGYDFVENDTIPQDECGHGTHVTGIAAAQGNNGIGIAGIAWNTSIMPVRVLGPTCGGSYADVAAALVWAVERGAKVINLSLGGNSPSTLLQNASYYAYTHGAAIFAAAGNAGASTDPPSPAIYPAAYPWVMAIGAVNSLSARAGFSNYGSALDLMAPGVSIYSTLPMQSGFYYNSLGYSPQYDFMTGTSMATPHAAGAAALLASLPAFNTPDKIYQALISTAFDLDVPGRDNNTGYGLIQLASALAFAPAIVPTPIPSFAVDYSVVNSISCGNLVQYNWRNALGGTPYVSVGNSGSDQINLPPGFNFSLGGTSYTSITAHANGYIAMGNNTASVADNFILPGIAQPNNFIAPFWDDLTDSGGAGLYTITLGSAPNRMFVIEYPNMQRVGVPGNLQFEVVLFETSNRILMQYRILTGAGADGSSATVGIEYGDGLAGLEYSYNKIGALTPNFALLFIPYPSGGVPPSNSCSTFTAPVNSAGGVYDTPTTYPFCATIPAGALQHPATLQIRLTQSAPAMPASFLDLRHYADITLAYSPAPPLSPMPEVYVCYHYTAQDVLAAGGHPGNLFIAAHDVAIQTWQALPTTVDTANSLLVARAPHFSYYGVATFNTTSNKSGNGMGLPVTGSPISRELSSFLTAFGVVVIFLFGGTWLRRKRGN